MRRIVFLFVFITLIFAGSFSVSAYESGTYEKGLNLKNYQIYSLDPADEFKNGDFSEGFKYWGAMLEGGPSVNAKIVSRDQNNYMQLAPVREYGGVMSLKFICNAYDPGDFAVVIYDFKGSLNHQVYLNQDIDNGIRICNGYEIIKEADGKDEWNTAVTLIKDCVQAPTDGNQNLVFYIGLQATTDLNADTCFDNVRLGKLDENGKVYDLSGNEIGISGQKHSDETKTENVIEDKKDDVASKTPEKEEKISMGTLTIILLSVFAVLFVGFDIFLFVSLKRKKKK